MKGYGWGSTPLFCGNKSDSRSALSDQHLSCASTRIILKNIIVLLFLLLAGNHLFSKTVTWGGIDSNWNRKNNWSNNKLPGNNDRVVIPSGCYSYPVLNTFVQIRRIELNGNSYDRGRISLGANHMIADNVRLLMSGGVFYSRGYTDVVKSLKLNQSSAIVLGGGEHYINFGSVKNIAWTTGSTLVIYGWKGDYNGSSGEEGKIFFGDNEGGLTDDQLAQIRFHDGSKEYEAVILPTGEVVPVVPDAKFITTGFIAGAPFCAGDVVTIPYIKTGYFSIFNEFTAQLSDVHGNFDSPIAIGSVNSSQSGTITGVIPVDVLPGTGYRIRVVSSWPVRIGSDNGIDITIDHVEASFIYPQTSYSLDALNPLPVFQGMGEAGVFTSSPGLVFVDSGTGEIDLAASAPGTYTVTNTVDGGACGTVSASCVVTLVTKLLWTGVADTQWYNVLNWSTGSIPGEDDDVVIPEGCPHYPVITGTINVRSIALQGTGSVQRGALRWADKNVLDDNTDIILAGGVMNTGEPYGFMEVVNTLTLTEDSYIELGTLERYFDFKSSVDKVWTPGKTLTIRGWRGPFDGGKGTDGRIYFSFYEGGNGLTPQQISQIRFDDGNRFYPATLRNNGEVVPYTEDLMVGHITGSPFCAGDVISVPFYLNGYFYYNHQFIAQLSDENGSFATPVNIGSLDAKYDGVISCVLPANTVNGNGYRIRVVCSDMGVTTPDNGIDIVINNVDAAFVYNGSPFCPGVMNPIPVFSGMAQAGVFTSSDGLVFVDNTTGEIDLAASDEGDYVVTNTVDGGGCGPVSAQYSVTILKHLVWTGAISSDWNDADNWSCNVLPDLTTSVSIPNVFNQPLLNGGALGEVKSITIEAGAAVTVVDNTLKIAGLVVNNGVFYADQGTVEFCGDILQTVSAGLFSGDVIQNLSIDNLAGVQLLGLLKVTGVVLAKAGTLSADGNLTLVSTAGQTALIDGSGNGNITGDVVMQRYIDKAFGYQYLSSPFVDATVSEWDGAVDLSASFPALYRYDEERMTTGWVAYTAPGNFLQPVEGYAANLGSGTGDVTIAMQGVVNHQALNVNLYNRNRPYTRGFNLVGNPYPSPVDWDAAEGWTKLGIDNALYYFQASDADQYGGVYRTYINGISSDGKVSGIIPSMQGVFVHVSDGAYPVSGMLGMDNRVRVNDLSHAFTKSIRENTKTYIRLSAAFDESTADYLVICRNSQVKKGFDEKYDALKLMNTDSSVPDFYALSADGRRLSVHAVPNREDSLQIVPLGLKLEQDGVVRLGICAMENYPAQQQVYLLDRQQKVYHNMVRDGAYPIYLAAGDYVHRFSLCMTADEEMLPDVEAKVSFHASCLDGLVRAEVLSLMTGEGEITLYDMPGHELYSQKVYNEGVFEFIPPVKSGIYIIRFLAGKTICSQKLYIH